ncbi:MAG: ImmA/IrrE family metallo-endopeptidase [Planctomycetaceae bacterium]|nr:ImmA/IrrE family metallo-endopeptidase [Planctomycetaceae bacterium]
MSAEYNLRELISYNGGTVHDITFEQFQQFKEKGVLDNSIYVNKTRDFDIVIHAYLPYYHTRYTLAHELGHYTLHADDKSYAKQKGNDQIEIEAHYFALGLLLPETLFYSGYKLSKDTDELSLILCVPPKLINTRKKLLNLK